jgi:putative ABC transport system permease protein
MLALIRTNALRRWGRTALTALGVAIGVMTIVALLSLTSGLSRSAGDLAKLGRADFGVFQAGLADLTASSLPGSVVTKIRAVPGVAQASPVQIVPNAVAGDPSILIFGSEPDSFLSRRLVLTAGRRARGSEAMVGPGAAERLDVGPGDVLSTDGGRFPVAGIYRSGVSFEDNGVVLPLAVTQRAFDRGDETSMVAVSISPGYPEAGVEREIERRIPGTVAIGDPGEVARVDTNSRVISKAAIVITVLAVLIGAVVVTNTMAMSMMQRQGEFGLLAAVGWSRTDIAKLIVGEGLFVSLIGTAVGLALGVLAGEVLVQVLAAATFVSPDLTAWVLVRGLLVGVGLGVLGALFSVSQVLRVPPLQALGRS